MNRVLDSLRQFQLAQAAAFRRAGEVLGVPDTVLITLHTLIVRPEGGGLSMKQLAREVGVSPAVMTGIVDRLEQRHWARRELNATDRRSVVVVATIENDPRVEAILQSLDRPLRRVANSIDEDSAVIVRGLANDLVAQLRDFDPSSVSQVAR
jgi:DNA-binding MarR family transcriptional regulator